MARERSPNRDKAFELYKESNGEIQNREIANILDIPEKTVSAWKSRYKWATKINVVLQNDECSTAKVKKSSKRKKEPIAKEVEEVINSDGLTEKQRLFCLYYTKTFNATRSYQRAYACSYEVALVNGSRLLKNAKVKAEVEELKALRMNSDFVDANDVVRQFQEIAFTDEVILDGAEVKLSDKLKALDFLAKYYKLLESENESKEDKLDNYLQQLKGAFKDD